MCSYSFVWKRFCEWIHAFLRAPANKWPQSSKYDENFPRMDPLFILVEHRTIPATAVRIWTMNNFIIVEWKSERERNRENGSEKRKNSNNMLKREIIRPSGLFGCCALLGAIGGGVVGEWKIFSNQVEREQQISKQQRKWAQGIIIFYFLGSGGRLSLWHLSLLGCLLRNDDVW